MLPLLDQLAEELTNNFKDINFGGCGVIAHNMLQLLDTVATDIEVVFIDDIPQNIKNAQYIFDDLLEYPSECTLANLSHSGIECTHAYVKFTYKGERYGFDTDYGVMQLDTFKDIVHNRYDAHESICIDPEVLELIVGNAAGWCSNFNRHEIGGIEAMIGQYAWEIDHAM